MKIKGILITTAIIGGSAAAVVYGVRSTVTKKPKPVEVVAVTSVNNSYGGFSDGDSIIGTIISKDTQQVLLDGEHELKTVYVKEGDQVKKGDKLLEYDMEADELKAEMEDLTRRGLELSLETLMKDLATLRSGRMPVGASDDDDSSFGFDPDEGSSKDDDADYEDADATGSADALPEDTLSEGGLPEGSLLADELLEDTLPVGEISNAADAMIDDETEQEEVIIEPEDGEYNYVIEDLDDPDSDMPVGDGSGDGIIPGYEQELLASVIGTVNDFLNGVNDVTEVANSDDTFKTLLGQQEKIASLLALFREQLGDYVEHREISLLGESIMVKTWYVSDAVRAQVGDATSSVLKTAYERLCAFQFINAMNNLNPSGSASSSYTEADAKAAENAIRAAVEAYHELPVEVFSNNKFTTAYDALNRIERFSGDNLVSFLDNMIQLLSGTAVLETTAIPDIPTFEGAEQGAGLDDLDDGGAEEPEYTAEDIANAIKEQEKNIKECELQIREAELEIKDYQRVLDGRVVYATMDGMVKSAGTVDHQPTDGPFILITGKAGLYVRGTINELSLETVHVGDMISGTSYETGGTFTAEITEISEFPNDNSNDYYGYGDENSNASYYPFLAYIENAEGLEVDAYVELTLNSSGGSGGKLMLDEFYVRTDGNGRSYCFVEGDDGLLEKRYLNVGSKSWGTLTIDSGLSREDFIAFPYGDGVMEGAQTVEVQSLSAVNGDDYY